MGSKVEPYFILTAEKLPNPKESVSLYPEKTPPITPAPSGAFSSLVEEETLLKKSKLKAKFIKYTIPVKEVRKKVKLTRKMELIKQKLEKSRERFNLKKRVETDPDLKCEPGVFGNKDTSELPYKMDRSVSDLTPMVKDKENQGGATPFVYFVVSEEQLRDSYDSVTLETGEKIKSKSADKRRRVRIVEENRLKMKEKKGAAKMQGLAREIGLKSDIDSKPESRQDPRPPTRQPSVNQIVFPGAAYEVSSQKLKPNVHVIQSPPRIPPGTPATTLAYSASDPDENIPRKPFLSGPLYAGKAKIDSAQASPMFGLPEIPADQKRKALGLATRFEEFAYNSKPQSSQSKRQVTFADSLPVIKGSGFVLESRHEIDMDTPSLGPRAVTMGSITLPSERLDKQSMCQKYLLGENMSSVRATRRNGVPLPLPKIDIVSNVYDEMIIKMIQEYLQDSNTPSRQSYLAKELLVHLQKHGEAMKEINVPNLKNVKNRPEFFKQTSLKLQSMLRVPPNTAEGTAIKTLGTTGDSTEMPNNDKKETNEEDREETRQKSADKKTPDKMETIPFVQITFKNKEGNQAHHFHTPDQLPDMPDEEIVPPKSSEGARETHTSQSDKKPRPVLTQVTPVSFQMAPPGLSKEDTNLSIQMRT